MIYLQKKATMDFKKKLKINLKKVYLDLENFELTQQQLLEKLNNYTKKNKIYYDNQLVTFHQSELSRIENFRKISFHKYLIFLSFLNQELKINLNKFLKF